MYTWMHAWIHACVWSWSPPAVCTLDSAQLLLYSGGGLEVFDDTSLSAPHHGLFSRSPNPSEWLYWRLLWPATTQWPGQVDKMLYCLNIYKLLKNIVDMTTWTTYTHRIHYRIRYTCLIEDVVKTTWINSNWESEWGRNGEARQAALSTGISETADLLVYSYTTILQVYRAWFWKSIEWQFCWQKCRMGRLVGKNRKATITWYNQEMQNNISEHTTHQTMNNMGYSSRRPHRLPLLSAQNSKGRLQFAHFYQAPKYQLSVV